MDDKLDFEELEQLVAGSYRVVDVSDDLKKDRKELIEQLRRDREKLENIQREYPSKLR